MFAIEEAVAAESADLAYWRISTDCSRLVLWDFLPTLISFLTEKMPNALGASWVDAVRGSKRLADTENQKLGAKATVGVVLK